MDKLLMTTRERRRLTEFSLVKQGRSSVAEAGRRLGLSERQARRLWKRYQAHGDAGLIHGLRGRPSNFRQAALQAQVLAVCRQKYAGCNVAHASELLAREEKLTIPRQTLWRWLKADGQRVAVRRCRQHRRRRERRPCVGELVQMDGSTHAWFGPDHPSCVLFVMVDDASGRVFCRFYATEDTASAFDLFGGYARRYGLPEALYVDFDSIYMVNDAQAREKARQAGKKPPVTQFGRAMEALGVRIIGAHSPQAKGRVERMNRTLQDRLLQELALAMNGQGIHDLAAANAFLEREFLPHFNERFVQPPAQGTNRHRTLPRGVKLDDVLCIQEARVVGQDWCVRYAGRILQIARCHERLRLTGKAVEVRQRPDGTLSLCYQGQKLVFAEVASRPVRATAAKPALPATGHPPYKPPADHPWRQGLPRRVPASAPLHSASLRSASLRSADAGTRVPGCDPRAAA
jgi:transposase